MPTPSLRILTVTSMYPTPEDPGLGAFVASQVESLRELGILVDVLFLDVRESKLELLRGAVWTRREVQAYDIVHAHFGYNGLPACAQGRCPVVVSFCGTDVMDRRLLRVSRWIADRADASIVKSEQLRRALGRPADIIPNGVDLGCFRPTDRRLARQKLGLDPNVRYALFAANPSRPEKRYDLACSAVAAAARLGEPLELLVMSNQAREEVPHYLNAADLLLLTSDWEGSPNVVKEAMACNLPVVTTDVGDVRQLLNGTRNSTVCERDPAAISAAIRAVIATNQRSNGRPGIAHLSSEAVAKRLLAVYQRVLSRRRSR